MPRTNKILIRSGTAAPSASDFATNEPAWDRTAKKLYIKAGDGTMVEIGASGGGGTVYVAEYATTANFPTTGQSTARIYVATDTGRIYRWTGTEYQELGAVSAYDSRWDLFLPPAPTNVTGTVASGQSVVSWTAPTVSAQTPITDYVVEYATSPYTSWTTFSDGTSTSTSATVTGLTNGTTYKFRVAGVNAIGTGAYSSASAEVTPAVSDTYYSSVKLLLHMNGTNNSTTFTDNSGTPKTVTAYGDAKISTAQSKFGGASGVFDGSGDYLGVASVGNIGTSDFVLEWWMRVADVSAYQHIIGTSTYGDFMVALLAPYNGAGAIGVGRDNVAWDFVRNASLSNNTWHHVAIARTSNTMYMYVDGSLVGSSGSNSNTYNIAALQIGAQSGGSTGPLNGYLDDLRLTLHGRGFTGSTITVPTAAYPDS